MREFKILAIGDVVGRTGTKYLSVGRRLFDMKNKLGADMVIVNGENASDGNGLLPDDCNTIFEAGADVITGGNHIWKRRELYNMLDDCKYLVRPANFPSSAPGHGYTVFDTGFLRVLVVNLLGTVYMDCAQSPFYTVDSILRENKGLYDIACVDIHAEATSEKLALARYLDGRAAVVFGTHTHIQTADASVLPGGTGYITDLGMCGSRAGVLGVATEPIIHKFTVMTPVRFTPAVGEESATGALFTVSLDDGKCICAEGVSF